MTSPDPLLAAVGSLTTSQRRWINAFTEQFKMPHTFGDNEKSDLVTDLVLENIGDLLRIHHAMSRRALSKAPFEYAFEQALKLAGKNADLAKSATNPGYDMTVNGQRISLKTEAAKSIKRDSIHVSKWMELGADDWDPPTYQRKNFLGHLNGYDRIFSLRCLVQTETAYEYELVEIPKALILEAEQGILEERVGGKQKTNPWYCRVVDEEETAKLNAPVKGKKKKKPKTAYKFSLYFDAGSERKLQVKKLMVSHCIIHATWKFNSVVLTPEDPCEPEDRDVDTDTEAEANGNGVEAIPESALAE